VTHRVQLRWEDIDGLGHVRHGAVLAFLEEGRDAFLESCGIGRRDYVVGHAEITYRREILLEQREVAARCEVTRLGRSSVSTREHLLDDAGEVLVEAAFGLVLWDAGSRASRPITPGERLALAPTEEAAR
jgi:acyl-CoA thioesterase FadM